MAAILGQISGNDRKLEAPIYEDCIRALMGSDAYLLFVFDSLIRHTLTHLKTFQSDDKCVRSINIFRNQPEVQNEYQYLAEFN